MLRFSDSSTSRTGRSEMKIKSKTAWGERPFFALKSREILLRKKGSYRKSTLETSTLAVSVTGIENVLAQVTEKFLKSLEKFPKVLKREPQRREGCKGFPLRFAGLLLFSLP